MAVSLINLALLMGVAAASPLVPKAPSSPGYLALSVARTRVSTQRQSDIQKRASNVTLTPSVGVYIAQLDIGNPPQHVGVILDTGSDNLWVNPSCSAAALNESALDPTAVAQCHASAYDASKSNSAVRVPNAKNFYAYGTGTANVSFVTDTISLPGTGASVSNVTFGVATSSSTIPAGILGVGFSSNEKFTQTNGNKLVPYPTFLDALVANGITATRAFSVGLGSVAANGDFNDFSDGAVVFGGVDVRKYQGSLTALPIIPNGIDPTNRYSVALSSIGITQQGGSPQTLPDSNLTVILDSGTTFSVLPERVVDQVAQELGGKPNATTGFIDVPCSLRDSTGSSFAFTFGSTTFPVPFSDFILDLFGDGVCVLPFQTLPDSVTGKVPALLGDIFLRSVYAVFDQDNKQVLLAPFKDCGSRIVAIEAGALSKRDTAAGECANEGNVTTGGTSGGGGSTGGSKPSNNAAVGQLSASTGALVVAAAAACIAGAWL